MPQVIYTVETEGLDEMTQRLRRYPEIERQVIVPTMKRVVIGVADTITRNTPVYQNRLQPAIKSSPQVKRIGGEVAGTVDAGNVPYAGDIEAGPPAGRWPDTFELRRWCELVLGDAGLTGAIALALYEGRSRIQRMRGYRMFATGWGVSYRWVVDQFRAARDEIVRRLAGHG